MNLDKIASAWQYTPKDLKHRIVSLSERILDLIENNISSEQKQDDVVKKRKINHQTEESNQEYKNPDQPNKRVKLNIIHVDSDDEDEYEDEKKKIKASKNQNQELMCHSALQLMKKLCEKKSNAELKNIADLFFHQVLTNHILDDICITQEFDSLAKCIFVMQNIYAYWMGEAIYHNWIIFVEQDQKNTKQIKIIFRLLS